MGAHYVERSYQFLDNRSTNDAGIGRRTRSSVRVQFRRQKREERLL
jgi:hypothetical protein